MATIYLVIACEIIGSNNILVEGLSDPRRLALLKNLGERVIVKEGLKLF